MDWRTDFDEGMGTSIDGVVRSDLWKSDPTQEDTDEDGFTDYDENLEGTDQEDPDDFPTQAEVAEAVAEQEAKFAE